MGANNTIVLHGNLGERRGDCRAAGNITPGHLIKVTGTESAPTAVVHPTAAGYGEATFAIEDALIGRTIDTVYASGDLVQYHIAQKGDVIYGWLAAGVAVTKGLTLVSNGDGSMKLVTGSEKQVIGYANETVDNSAGGSAVRLKIRVA